MENNAENTTAASAANQPSGGTEEKIRRAVNAVHSKFNQFAGIEKLEGFSLRKLMSEVFSKHDPNEIEESFCIGTPSTIPSIEEVDTTWPRPWMFFRALTFSILLYFGFSIAWEMFENTNLVPGLMLIGTVAIPVSTLIFFFEVNARRNISLFRIFRMVAIGGIFSLTISLLLFSLPLDSLGWMGASVAGLIEEPGKLLALIIVARSTQYKYKLNGLVLGAAVGAGFAIFESLGYATNALIGQVMVNSAAQSNMFLSHFGHVKNPVDAMIEIVKLRGLLSPLGHIVWTAICGAALWRVKGEKPFDFGMVMHAKFWHLFIIPVILHACWNANFNLPFYLKYITLGAVAWLIVFALIQEGLKELRAEKAAALANREAEDAPADGTAAD